MAITNSYDILQAVIEATPDAIFVKDLEGCYVVVNAAAARFLGRRAEDIIGKDDLELYPEDTARRFMADDQRVLTEGRPITFEGVATSGSSMQAYLVTKGVYRDAEGAVRGTFGISHDVTELRQANAALERTREALFRSQKMEAVGQLTGELAHDFNNVIAVILGNLDLLRAHLQTDVPGCNLIDTIVRAAKHAQELTNNLLTFAKGRQLNPKAVDVNAIIERIVQLLGRTLPPRIALTTDLSEDARIARADAAALEAAVLNVVLNARDAMPREGSVVVRTSLVETPVAGAPDLATGAYVVVSVADTGSGMPPEIAAHVFEPFFTTKTEGGTGLGLSMVQGFAQQCGGTVTLETAVGVGTTVRIYLPHMGASGR